jgi:hypothetical protein
MKLPKNKLKSQNSFTYFRKNRMLWVLISIFLGISFQIGIGVKTIPRVYAAVSSIGIANYVPVLSKNVQDGDIVSVGGNGYSLSTIPYDTNIFGVVTAHPSIMIKTSAQKGYPVINIGTAYVRVSGFNGSIQKGDMITTSNTPGIGMKADTAGYVVGQALENASFSNKNEEKEITISLNIHYLQVGSTSTSTISDLFNISKAAADQQPLRVFQYLMAALIITLSFAFGFLIFIRFINTGITALGRNPLASRAIQFSILMNVALVVIILISGVALAYFMLRLS